MKSPLVSVSCFPFPRPLHLSIIQENIPLTFYLVRLITGVSMNLDIANNLRQVSLHVVGMLKYFLSPSSSPSPPNSSPFSLDSSSLSSHYRSANAGKPVGSGGRFGQLSRSERQHLHSFSCTKKECECVADSFSGREPYPGV